MTEPELRQLVMQAAAAAGVLAHYCGRSTLCQGDKGLPDLILAGRHGILLAELKSRDGEVTDDQRRWLGRAAMDGSRGKLWRPDDWTSHKILSAITRIS